MSNNDTIIIAIDPGTGISSPTGFSAFNASTLDILYAANIGTNKKPLEHRIKDISDVFENTIKEIDSVYPNSEILLAFESFVMRGKGGETLQRLIGSLMGRAPFRFKLVHVQNTTVKLHMAGHGHAEKHQVANGTLLYFSGNIHAKNLILSLTQRNEYDILDSLAIGATACRIHLMGGAELKSKKQRKKLTKKE